jgi:Chitin binding Peritrophin-A domain
MNLKVLIGLLAIVGWQSVAAQTATSVPTNDSNCTSFGVYPDYESTDCSQYFVYILCVDDINLFRVSCLENFVFHWNDRICVPYTMFECPNLVTTDSTTSTSELPSTTTSVIQTTTTRRSSTSRSTTAQSTTTESTTTRRSSTTQSTTTQAPRTFTCPFPGNFPDPASTNCENFHNCTDIGGQPRKGTCNVGSIFNWQQSQCTSSDMIGCAASAPSFKCPEPGAWPNPNSRSCHTYIQCFHLWDGTVQHQIGFCSGANIFDGETRRCRLFLLADCRA